MTVDRRNNTDAINRAILLYHLIAVERAAGARFVLERANGERVEVAIL